jgi:hypothetical protein
MDSVGTPGPAGSRPTLGVRKIRPGSDEPSPRGLGLPMKSTAGVRHPRTCPSWRFSAAGIATIVDPPNRPRAALLAFPQRRCCALAVHVAVPSRRSAPRAQGLAIRMPIARTGTSGDTVARAATAVYGRRDAPGTPVMLITRGVHFVCGIVALQARGLGQAAAAAAARRQRADQQSVGGDWDACSPRAIVAGSGSADRSSASPVGGPTLSVMCWLTGVSGVEDGLARVAASEGSGWAG